MLSLHMPEPLWVWILVAGLAAFRLASIIHSEKIAAPIRRLFGVIENEIHQFGHGDPFEPIYPDTFFGHLLECFWCVSVWAAFGVTVVLIVWPWALIPFAVSALAILFRKWAD